MKKLIIMRFIGLAVFMLGMAIALFGKYLIYLGGAFACFVVNAISIRIADTWISAYIIGFLL